MVIKLTFNRWIDSKTANIYISCSRLSKSGGHLAEDSEAVEALVHTTQHPQA